jgi:5-methylcytosine-specific restriction endonuclease McrA
MLQTLVLNIAETPVAIVPYRRVLNRVCNNLAIVKRQYENTLIKSSGGIEMPIPSVVQCVKTNYIPKFTKVLPFTRLNVFIRDHGVCMYCGKKVGLNSFSFDHYVPRCRGGRTCWENILICCSKCNSKKGDKPASKFKEPIRMPYAPKLDKAAPVQLVNKIAAEIPHESWIDWIYWHIELEP